MRSTAVASDHVACGTSEFEGQLRRQLGIRDAANAIRAEEPLRI
jgi:hypothetical protein